MRYQGDDAVWWQKGRKERLSVRAVGVEDPVFVSLW